MIVFSTLIFILFATPQPETIPPLPIEQLKKIEMHYNDTLIKPFPVDTLFLRLYGWKNYGANIIFSHPIGKKSIFNIDAAAGKNQDYTSYYFAKGNIGIGWLTGNFWQEFGVSIYWKKRAQEYYQQIGLSYTPIWFISSATLMLDNTIRGAQYFNNIRDNFMTATSNLSYNTPSPLGIINTEANALIQNYYNAGTKTSISSTAGLSDFITIGDNFYIKPGASYNIEKRNLSIIGNIGFFIKGITTNIDVENNNVNTLYFDTLYSNAFPISVNRYLDYPICNWSFGLSINNKFLAGSVHYQQFRTFINWYPVTDTTIIPDYDTRIHRFISIKIQGTCSPIKNILSITYAPDKRMLIPLYTLAESLQFSIHNFILSISCCAYGKRVIETIESQIIKPSYIFYSSGIAYQWRYLKLFANVENILDNKFEIVPNRFDLGRKYYIGLEIIPERKK